MSDRLRDRKFVLDLLRIMASPTVRIRCLCCFKSALTKFFLFQFRHAWCPGFLPISRVDHPLDARIPFAPKKITVYLDFVAFWLRTAAFLLEQYGRRGLRDTARFIDGIDRLYDLAVEIYSRNLSTTDQPDSSAYPRFFLIRLMDPHLFCIPSLHIMIVIRAFTHFRAIVDARGDRDSMADRVAELRQGAVDIADSTMLVKQHSVNCIGATLYIMTRYDPQLWPAAEAEAFAASLLRGDAAPNEADAAALRARIIDLYRSLLDAGRHSDDWRRPVLDFLAACPPAEATETDVQTQAETAPSSYKTGAA